MAALERGVIFANVDDFYTLARLVLVKDESLYDKFDQAFAEYFTGVEQVDLAASIPPEWLEQALQRQLSDEDKAKLQALGGLDELLKTFRERLAEQQKHHAGGNKWIGTGGTSPFGAYGYNPEGIRVGQDRSNARRAVKVWISANLKIRWWPTTHPAPSAARPAQITQVCSPGAATELDLNNTIRATSQKADYLICNGRRNVTTPSKC